MTEYINTYNELCENVKRWSAAYYEHDAPVVTDEEYDRAMHEIRDIEAAHPELVTSDSPTQVVGGKRVSVFRLNIVFRCFRFWTSSLTTRYAISRLP